MEESDRVYTELQKHLDKQAVGFPATPSGVEIRILKELFTPEQARLALNLSYEPRSAADILDRLGSAHLSIESVRGLLDGMVGNGAIGVTERDGVAFYHTMPLLIGIVEWHGSRATPQWGPNLGGIHRRGVRSSLCEHQAVADEDYPRAEKHHCGTPRHHLRPYQGHHPAD
jgi:hypothetical protein